MKPSIQERPVSCFALLTCFALAWVGTASSQAKPANQLHSSPTRSPRTAISAADTTLLNTALNAYNAGQLAEAQPALEALAHRYPARADIQTAAGMCLLERGDLQHGLPYLEAAHRLTPGDLQVAQNLGIAYVKQNEATRGLALLQTVVSRAPRNYEARLALAQAEREAAQLEAAGSSFAEAAKLQSPTPEVLYDWAATLLAGGKTAEAATVIGRISPSATDANIAELRGEIEEKAGHPAAALASFRQAAELNPNPVTVQAYGEELLRHWTFPAAATVFEYGAKQFPESPRLRMDLGIAYFGNNDFSRASEVFSGMLAQDPENSTLADLLGRSCNATTSSSSTSCDHLTDFAQQHPGNAPAALYAAIMLLQRPESADSSRQAEVLLRRALEVNPKLAEGWYQLGVLQQQRSDWAGSEESLQRAVALRPSYAEAHYRLSRAYAHTGRQGDARAELTLQQNSATAAKKDEQKRMEGVLTFLTAPN